MTKKTTNDIPADKKVFTTGEAAKICNVSQQTIIRCFDSGRLQGFKVPGSRFRRIPRAELVRFMQANSMDLHRLESGPIQVLVIGLSSIDVESVIRSHAEGHPIQVHYADDAWTAGFLAHKVCPGLVLAHGSLPGISKEKILATLTSDSATPPMIVQIGNNYPNGLNVTSQFDDSKEVIRQAVQRLLSA